jgi:hypothetical protein
MTKSFDTNPLRRVFCCLVSTVVAPKNLQLSNFIQAAHNDVLAVNVTKMDT